SRTPWSAPARLLSDSALSTGSFVHDPLTLAADADLAAVAEDLVADARLCAALGAHELNVRRVERRFAFDDTALDVLPGIRPRVALDHVHAFHDQPVLAVDTGDYFQDAPALAAIFARHDEHVVVFSNGSCETTHIKFQTSMVKAPQAPTK